MKHFIAAIVVATVLVAGFGCASSRSSKVYSRDQARSAHTVQTGTVARVEPVRIEGTKSGVGTAAGGVAGGVLGSQVGSGSGRVVGGVIGALAGAAAGAFTEEKVTEANGLEITVDLADGGQVVVVQEADEAFNVGDQVRVIRGADGTTRVRH